MPTDRVYFLPAGTRPDLFGLPDGEARAVLGSREGASWYRLDFGKLVWYNAVWRRRVLSAIDAHETAAGRPDRRFLVGFSKSGLGAFTLLAERPDLFAGALIFDAPLVDADATRLEIPDFYPDPADFRADLPVGLLPERAEAFAGKRLGLISGERWASDMAAAHVLLEANAIPHAWVPGEDLPHRWDAGWLVGWLPRLLGRWGAERRRLVDEDAPRKFSF